MTRVLMRVRQAQWLLEPMTRLLEKTNDDQNGAPEEEPPERLSAVAVSHCPRTPMFHASGSASKRREL